MFTGLVEDLGTVTSVDTTTDGVRIAISSSLARELSEGDSVAVMCRNHRYFIEATMACAKLGAVALYLNTAFAGPQLVDVLERQVLIYTDGLIERRDNHGNELLDRVREDRFAAGRDVFDDVELRAAGGAPVQITFDDGGLPADPRLGVAAVPQHGVLRFTRLIEAHRRAAGGRVPMIVDGGAQFGVVDLQRRREALERKMVRELRVLLEYGQHFRQVRGKLLRRRAERLRLEPLERADRRREHRRNLLAQPRPPARARSGPEDHRPPHRRGRPPGPVRYGARAGVPDR